MSVRAILCLVGLFSLAATSGCYNSALDFKQMAAVHRSTEAQVVHLACNEHGAVYYAFWVDGREYRGRAPGGLFTCASTKLGEKRLVYYHPDNPNIHSLFMPSEAYARAKGWYIPEWWWFTVVPLIFVGASVVTEVVRGRKRHAQKT